MYCQSLHMSQVFSKLHHPRFSRTQDSLSYVIIKPQLKHKRIGKCQLYCRKHRFSLKKAQNLTKQRSLFKITDNTQTVFCPNQFFGITQGGYPVFNYDGRSDTPAFNNKYQMNNIQGNKLHAEQFLKRKKRIQRSKSFIEIPTKMRENLDGFSQSNRNINSQVIEEFQNILKQKNQRTPCTH